MWADYSFVLFYSLIPESFACVTFLGLLSFAIVYGRFAYQSFYSLLNKPLSYLISLNLLIILLLYISQIDSTFTFYHVASTPWLTFYKLLIVLFGIIYFSLVLFLPSYLSAMLFEVPLIMFLAIIGMLLLLSANSFIFFFSALELQSLSLYLLAASIRTSIYAVEAAFKYFILGAVSSCLLLFAFALLYFLTGLATFSDIQYFFLTHNFFSSFELASWFTVAAFFLLIALLFKLAIAPFHTWAPDLYEGVPYYLTAFFVIFPKFAIAAALFKIYFSIFFFFDTVNYFLLFIGTFSILFGSFAAIAQRRIKRLIAYSGISNFGFLILALATGFKGIFAFFSFSLIYGFLSLNFFSLIFFLRKEHNEIKTLDELAPLYRSYPLPSFLIAMNFFSLAAVPPLAGFFSKFVVLLSLVDAHLYLILILILLSTVVSAFYYIRVVKTLFFLKNNATISFAIPDWPAHVFCLTGFLNITFMLFFPSIATALLLLNIQLI